MDQRATPDFDIRDYLRLERMPHFLCPGCGHGIGVASTIAR